MRLKKGMPKIVLIVIPLIIILFVSVYAIISANKPAEVIDKEEMENEIEIVPYSDFNWSCLSQDERRKYEDDKYTSMFGIDVSTFQDAINWNKVKNDGVEFAFIRLGYRGAQEGALHIDTEFENNYEKALENGLKIGVYWYSQPVDEQEVIEEAHFVLNAIKDKHLDFPIVYDLEETMYYDGTVSRIHDFTKEQFTSFAKVFCEEIKKYHHDVMIYTGLHWSEDNYNMDELIDYPIWLAQYSSVPTFDYPFVMWQYTEDGQVDGINTSVDYDILFIQKNDQN